MHFKTKQLKFCLGMAAILLTACNNDPYRAVYEGIKMQNEANKTPQEREANPSPSYDAYKKERDAQSGK
jgi:hypothetical protein